MDSSRFLSFYLKIKIWDAVQQDRSVKGRSLSPAAVSSFSKGDAGGPGEAAAPAVGGAAPVCSCHCARQAAVATARIRSTRCRVRAAPSNAAQASDTAAS